MTAIDPVTLQILWSRLINVADECWLTIARTAFSLIVSESYDFGCELLDAQGDSFATLRVRCPRSTSRSRMLRGECSSGIRHRRSRTATF